MLVRNKVLIVNDEPGLRIVLSAIVEHAGYPSITAGSVRDAVGQLHSQPVRLVLVDVNDGQGDGCRFLSEVGKLDPNLPLLLIGTQAGLEKTSELQGKVLMACLEKPVEARRLISKIKELLA